MPDREKVQKFLRNFHKSHRKNAAMTLLCLGYDAYLNDKNNEMFDDEPLTKLRDFLDADTEAVDKFNYIHSLLEDHNEKHNFHNRNTLFKYPFYDKYGSVKDALTYPEESIEFIHLTWKDQLKKATTVYIDLAEKSGVNNKIVLYDVLKGLEMLSLSYPKDLEESMVYYYHKMESKSAGRQHTLKKSTSPTTPPQLTIELSHWLDIVKRCIQYTSTRNNSQPRHHILRKDERDNNVPHKRSSSSSSTTTTTTTTTHKNLPISTNYNIHKKAHHPVVAAYDKDMTYLSDDLVSAIPESLLSSGDENNIKQRYKSNNTHYHHNNNHSIGYQYNNDNDNNNDIDDYNNDNNNNDNRYDNTRIVRHPIPSHSRVLNNMKSSQIDSASAVDRYNKNRDSGMSPQSSTPSGSSNKGRNTRIRGNYKNETSFNWNELFPVDDDIDQNDPYFHSNNTKNKQNEAPTPEYNFQRPTQSSSQRQVQNEVNAGGPIIFNISPPKKRSKNKNDIQKHTERRHYDSSLKAALSKHEKISSSNEEKEVLRTSIKLKEFLHRNQNISTQINHVLQNPTFLHNFAEYEKDQYEKEGGDGVFITEPTNQIYSEKTTTGSRLRSKSAERWQDALRNQYKLRKQQQQHLRHDNDEDIQESRRIHSVDSNKVKYRNVVLTSTSSTVDRRTRDRHSFDSAIHLRTSSTHTSNDGNTNMTISQSSSRGVHGHKPNRNDNFFKVSQDVDQIYVPLSTSENTDSHNSVHEVKQRQSDDIDDESRVESQAHIVFRSGHNKHRHSTQNDVESNSPSAHPPSPVVRSTTSGGGSSTNGNGNGNTRRSQEMIINSPLWKQTSSGAWSTDFTSSYTPNEQLHSQTTTTAAAAAATTTTTGITTGSTEMAPAMTKLSTKDLKSTNNRNQQIDQVFNMMNKLTQNNEEIRQQKKLSQRNNIMVASDISQNDEDNMKVLPDSPSKTLPIKKTVKVRGHDQENEPNYAVTLSNIIQQQNLDNSQLTRVFNQSKSTDDLSVYPHDNVSDIRAVRNLPDYDQKSIMSISVYSEDELDYDYQHHNPLDYTRHHDDIHASAQRTLDRVDSLLSISSSHLTSLNDDNNNDDVHVYGYQTEVVGSVSPHPPPPPVDKSIYTHPISHHSRHTHHHHSHDNSHKSQTGKQVSSVLDSLSGQDSESLSIHTSHTENKLSKLSKSSSSSSTTTTASLITQDEETRDHSPTCTQTASRSTNISMSDKSINYMKQDIVIAGDEAVVVEDINNEADEDNDDDDDNEDNDDNSTGYQSAFSYHDSIIHHSLTPEPEPEPEPVSVNTRNIDKFTHNISSSHSQKSIKSRSTTGGNSSIKSSFKGDYDDNCQDDEEETASHIIQRVEAVFNYDEDGWGQEEDIDLDSIVYDNIQDYLVTSTLQEEWDLTKRDNTDPEASYDNDNTDIYNQEIQNIIKNVIPDSDKDHISQIKIRSRRGSDVTEPRIYPKQILDSPSPDILSTVDTTEQYEDAIFSKMTTSTPMKISNKDRSFSPVDSPNRSEILSTATTPIKRRVSFHDMRSSQHQQQLYDNTYDESSELLPVAPPKISATTTTSTTSSSSSTKAVNNNNNHNNNITGNIQKEDTNNQWEEVEDSQIHAHHVSKSKRNSTSSVAIAATILLPPSPPSDWKSTTSSKFGTPTSSTKMTTIDKSNTANNPMTTEMSTTKYDNNTSLNISSGSSLVNKNKPSQFPTMPSHQNIQVTSTSSLLSVVPPTNTIIVEDSNIEPLVSPLHNQSSPVRDTSVRQQTSTERVTATNISTSSQRYVDSVERSSSPTRSVKSTASRTNNDDSPLSVNKSATNIPIQSSGTKSSSLALSNMILKNSPVRMSIRPEVRRGSMMSDLTNDNQFISVSSPSPQVSNSRISSPTNKDRYIDSAHVENESNQKKVGNTTGHKVISMDAYIQRNKDLFTSNQQENDDFLEEITDKYGTPHISHMHKGSRRYNDEDEDEDEIVTNKLMTHPSLYEDDMLTHNNQVTFHAAVQSNKSVNIKNTPYHNYSSSNRDKYTSESIVDTSDIRSPNRLSQQSPDNMKSSVIQRQTSSSVVQSSASSFTPLSPYRNSQVLSKKILEDAEYSTKYTSSSTNIPNVINSRRILNPLKSPNEGLNHSIHQSIHRVRDELDSPYESKPHYTKEQDDILDISDFTQYPLNSPLNSPTLRNQRTPNTANTATTTSNTAVAAVNRNDISNYRYMDRNQFNASLSSTISSTMSSTITRNHPFTTSTTSTQRYTRTPAERKSSSEEDTDESSSLYEHELHMINDLLRRHNSNVSEYKSNSSSYRK